MKKKKYFNILLKDYFWKIINFDWKINKKIKNNYLINFAYNEYLVTIILK
jgi:hypothetical protein